MVHVKKVFILGILLNLILLLCITNLYDKNKYLHWESLSSDRNEQSTLPNKSIENLRLLTIFTTFVDDPTNEYRMLVQTNFLRMSNFRSFHEQVRFVVFTRNRETTTVIKKHYPNVISHFTPLIPGFTTPTYKILFKVSMNLSKSFFYMQTNACDLFDSSLVFTLKAIKEAWMKGLIRQKIMIYGRRHNVIIEGPVEDEFQVLEYFKRSVEFIHGSEDYIILTKETIEFDLFSETLMGRQKSDNALVDFGVHNEVESFDSSKSILLVHQSQEGKLEGNSLSALTHENEWDDYVTEGLRDHYSITCARYSTELDSENRVKIFDKKTLSVVDIESREDNEFFRSHQYWIDVTTFHRKVHSKPIPDLVVVVLACNKPDSLSRLLNSLVEVDYEGDRVDLVISLDIGYLGLYDLPTLILVKKLSWQHGEMKIVLKDKHRGQLNQWLEAYSSVDTKEDSPILILEDNLQLSPFWYGYLKGVLFKSYSRLLHKSIAGWTLEAPYPGSSDSEDSSVMLGNIRLVRSFVPVLSTWISFLNWYNKESSHIPPVAFSKSTVFKLDHRGYWSNWERSVWMSWYWYYLKVYNPEQLDILYIFDKRGSLASKTRITYPNWNRSENPGCYDKDGLLEGELLLQDIDPSEMNGDIKIPEVIPTFNFDTL